jgi:dihydropteroate synthase
MGICNVTPDSFSDGGRFASREAACARVDAILAQGADIVDIGGESTRPGSAPVAPSAQIARVLEVVRYAADRGACVSIDTTSAEVAAACLDAGACAVNDVSCLRDDDLAKVCASQGAALVLMHARGAQSEMKGFSAYAEGAYGDDVVAAVMSEWREAANRAEKYGVSRDGLVMDPGLGFAKNARHSMELLERTRDLVREAGVPVLIGASRKSFLAIAGASDDPRERMGASIAAALFAARAGAAILRVHDVAATREALDLDHALNHALDCAVDRARRASTSGEG